MLVRLIEQMTRRREHPIQRMLVGRCLRCGRDYQKAWPSHATMCWWCASLTETEDDPYVDLGGGD